MNRIVHTWLVVLLLAPAALAGERSDVIAVLGAFDDEVELLERRLEDPQVEKILGLRFRTGTIAGQPVVVARTGIGKVNAAMTTTLLIEHFRPRRIVFTGVAGALSPELGPGDLLLATKTVQHDRGNLTAEGVVLRGFPSPLDGERDPVFFPGDETLRKLALVAAKDVEFEPLETPAGRRKPRVRTGVVATGDVFVTAVAAKKIVRDRSEADAVEMEGAAVAQVCHQLGVPLLVIRSISDNADENASRDFAKFAPVAARNSVRLVEALLRRVRATRGTRRETRNESERRSRKR